MGEGPRRRGARARRVRRRRGRLSAGTTASEPITGVRPVWSPNGRQIAFADIVGSTTAGSWGIFVVNADGTGRRQVTRGSLFQPHGIAWSPDGNTLAFDAYVSDGPTSVYTVPVAGGNASKVTTGWSPAWASGSKLVVTDESEGPFGRDVQLYSVNPDGTGRQMFVQCPENQFDQPCGDGDPVFSPDATKIAFDNNLSGAASAVYTMNADGSGRRQLTPYSPPATLPQWGPNASALVYERKDLGGDTTKDTIHAVNADGSGDKELVKNAHQPSWSPDGKTILFTRSDGPTFTLYAMNADGTDVHQLTGPADDDDDHHAGGHPVRRPEGGRQDPREREEAPHEGALQDRQGDEGPLGEGEDRRGRLGQAEAGPLARGGHGRRAVGQPRQEIDRVRASR